jgi:putative tributyrin esterase
MIGLANVFRALLCTLVLGMTEAPPSAAQVTARADSLYSPSLGHTMRFVVVLPDGYDSTGSYPVLWLLHGYGDNDSAWLNNTQLAHYLRPYPLVVVLPDAQLSWYVNALGDPAARFEDYLILDLAKAVAAHYRVDLARQAIAGLSMGGYGAAVLGLRHTDRFRFIGALSAVLTVPRDIERFDSLGGFAVPSLQLAFGNGPSEFRDRHDPFLLFRRTPPESLPFFYMAIGTADEFRTLLPRNREFADSLRAYGARYSYSEQPAHHAWVFWNRVLPDLLSQVWQTVTAPRASSPH